MALAVLSAWLLFWTSLSSASFELYRFYDADYLSNYYGLSSTCITALNATVDCDEAATTMAGKGVDLNYWYMNNITTLCQSNCENSLNTWLSNVETVCADDTVIQSGVEVQAKALVLQFTYNYGLACLQDSSQTWCFYESQSWTGSDYIRWDPSLCLDINSTVPQCNDDTFSISDISTEMQAMTSLYDPSLYCSECYLELLRQRMLDPWLAPTNFTDYLIEQFEDIQGNCSTTLPYTTSSSTLYIGTATTTVSASASATTTTSVITTTCAGQALEALETPLICNDLSDTYNVTTGDARVATGDYFCVFNSTICLPPPCVLDTVWDQPSCTELAGRYSNSTYNITLAQFLSWNPNIQGSCDNIAMGQRVCQEAPGGIYPSPVASIYAPTGTSAYYTTAIPAAPTQTGTIPDCGNYYLVTAGDSCNGVALQAGINFTQLQDYNKYLFNNCTNLWLSYDVCVAEVTPPTLSTDGTCGPGVTCVGTDFGPCCSAYGDCGSTEEYCGSDGGTATTNGTCGPSVGGLTCTNPDFGPCCSVYGFCGNSTDFCGTGNCYSGACDTDTGGLSTNGECGPLFAGNKTCTGTQFGSCCSISGFCGSTSDYCSPGNCYSGACGNSSTSSSSSSSTSTSTLSSSVSSSATVATPPGPTRTGIAANCNAWTLTPATGASCAAIESEYDITFAQFYAWNPAVGSNCGSLWAQEAYCVGVSG